MEAPPFPGANPPIDPQVEAAIAAEHQRRSSPWYLFGKAVGVVLSALAGFAILYGLLLLALVVIGGFDLDLRGVLGVTLALAVSVAAFNRSA